MAQKKNQLIVAELDRMASELEDKGNSELAGLIDEVSAELLLDTPTVAAKAPKEPKMAPKPAKSNGKRRKKNKKKTAAPKLVVSRADAKKILKAAHSELLEIAGELIKDGDLKEARHIIKYAEEVQAEEEKLDVPMAPEMPAGLAPAETDEEPSDDDDDDDLEGDEGDEDEDDALPGTGDEEDEEEDDLEGDEEDEDADDDVEAMIRKYELGDDSPAAPASPDPKPSAPVEDKPKSSKSSDEPKSSKSSDEPKSSKSSDEPKSSKSSDEPKSSKSSDEPKSSKSSDEPKSEKSSKSSKSSDEPKSEDKAEDKAEKEAKVRLFNLAKKLAVAGEIKLAYNIVDLLDRK